MAADRAVPNRTLRRVSRTGVDRMNPSLRGICGTSAYFSSPPPYGGLWRPGIINKRQSTSPNFWESNELDASIDGNFSDDTIAPPVLTQLFSDKISNSSIKDLYAICRMHLVTYPVNYVAPQFVTKGFSTV